MFGDFFFLNEYQINNIKNPIVPRYFNWFVCTFGAITLLEDILLSVRVTESYLGYFQSEIL